MRRGKCSGPYRATRPTSALSPCTEFHVYLSAYHVKQKMFRMSQCEHRSPCATVWAQARVLQLAVLQQLTLLPAADWPAGGQRLPRTQCLHAGADNILSGLIAGSADLPAEPRRPPAIRGGLGRGRKRFRRGWQRERGRSAGQERRRRTTLRT